MSGIKYLNLLTVAVDVILTVSPVKATAPPIASFDHMPCLMNSRVYSCTVSASPPHHLSSPPTSNSSTAGREVSSDLFQAPSETVLYGQTAL